MVGWLCIRTISFCQRIEKEFRSSGVQEFRSSGVQEFRSSGVQEFRSSGVQEFRSSGVQEFRSSGVQRGEWNGIASQNSDSVCGFAQRVEPVLLELLPNHPRLFKAKIAAATRQRHTNNYMVEERDL